ncbi:MAG: hypothetical protein A2015_12745 [Spirochaetes bacterium GWF1_31_7]|nr:MAG: hypothetical protein A2Y30_10535 [Spirochaetes bacterium GWE1_32_154]OHD49250.1 MAG: hypothetical protein A2Y29_16165 [Spirochaetes bacterium GWE2_31_10]OHD51812.1 MAG: hypothetical protein A2015_12745 [Spirochaetes bacterium GWF1_31_7]OHD78491.1 MAG: hypothetical protein A2355_05705 [Spirochaetes bacterium RIFOXYB1_FULL_32_8]HBD95330.1 PHP domain-containing protein [Spirochaetia bacterium]
MGEKMIITIVKNKYIDMHIHSYYSDGTMSPEEIIETALSKNVKYIAITDHNSIAGSLELLKLSERMDYGIKCLSGVELDVIFNNINYHILGYGFDTINENLNRIITKNRELLESVNLRLITKIEKEYPQVTISDYELFNYDKRKGGWKALHYLLEKGLVEDLTDGLRFYSKYNYLYSSANFPFMKEICTLIHDAGGKAILAHPGKTVKKNSVLEFKEEIKKIINNGIDGIECYYPQHNDEITKTCVELCHEHDLLITSGSDCHGSFGESNLGEMHVTQELLKTGNLFDT